MDVDLLSVAFRYREQALEALHDKRGTEGLFLLEMACTAAFMAKSATPLTFKLLPSASLPRPIASVEHAILRLTRRGIAIFAPMEIVLRPLCDLRRFPMVGEFFSGVAKLLPDEGVFECVVDLGDGDDAGDYRRLAYSSARPDSILVPDPLFYINENYDRHRAYVAQRAKPWRNRQDILFWRGGAGGPRLGPPDPTSGWTWQQRLNLCAHARASAWAEHMDVALSHHRPIPEADLRAAIEAAGFLGVEVPKIQFLDYRYLFDVDGWTNAWSLLDKLISGATVLKVGSAFGYRQWFYDRLIPWENYVPLASDLSDFEDVVAWVLAHPEDCEMIAAKAAALGASIQLRPEMEAAQQRTLAALTPVTAA